MNVVGVSELSFLLVGGGAVHFFFGNHVLLNPKVKDSGQTQIGFVQMRGLRGSVFFWLGFFRLPKKGALLNQRVPGVRFLAGSLAFERHIPMSLIQDKERQTHR